MYCATSALKTSHPMVEFVDDVMNIFHRESIGGQLPPWLVFFDAAHDVQDEDIADEYGHFTIGYKLRVAHRIQTRVAGLLSCI